MTELSRIIFEKYQIRKSKNQKTEFINLLKENMPVNIQTGGLLKSRNIIVGDVEKLMWFLQPIMIPARLCRFQTLSHLKILLYICFIHCLYVCRFLLL